MAKSTKSTKSAKSTKRKRPAQRKQSLEEQYLASMPPRFPVEPDQDPYPEELVDVQEAASEALAETMTQALAEPQPPRQMAPRAKSQPPQLSLAEIRNEVLKAQTRNAHTIADLEAWRAEIDATIAFLKSRDR